jgi:ligand-binding SRPBCC domain-containing protein
MARVHHLQRIQHIPRPRREVFAWFADASNLAHITPPELRFTILTPLPLAVGPGMLLDYKLRILGVPVAWRTRIERFQPDDLFSDVQLKGPYRRWHHLHEFADAGDGTTEMRDTVDYELPLGPLGTLARALFVRRSLEHIFDYRRDRLTEIFRAA